MGADNGADHAEAFDLDAVKRESTKEPFRFTYSGETFTLPDPEDIDAGTVARLDQSNPIQIFEHFLGDQWQVFADLKPPMWKLRPLLDAWSEHYGIDLGESSASPPSSNRAARRSRPTSAKRTGSGSPTSTPAV